jgi:hypothetical protein
VLKSDESAVLFWRNHDFLFAVMRMGAITKIPILGDASNALSAFSQFYGRDV